MSMQNFAALIQKSFLLRKKSEELLEEAKAAVEAEIERGGMKDEKEYI